VHVVVVVLVAYEEVFRDGGQLLTAALESIFLEEGKEQRQSVVAVNSLSWTREGEVVECPFISPDSALQVSRNGVALGGCLGACVCVIVCVVL